MKEKPTQESIIAQQRNLFTAALSLITFDASYFGLIQTGAIEPHLIPLAFIILANPALMLYGTYKTMKNAKELDSLS